MKIDESTSLIAVIVISGKVLSGLDHKKGRLKLLIINENSLSLEVYSHM